MWIWQVVWGFGAGIEGVGYLLWVRTVVDEMVRVGIVLEEFGAGLKARVRMECGLKGLCRSLMRVANGVVGACLKDGVMTLHRR